MNKSLPIFYFKVCCNCGKKTLVYPNGICRLCILKMNLKAVVNAYKQVSLKNRIRDEMVVK
jgi:predicted amidophosphoribosyltransferase